MRICPRCPPWDGPDPIPALAPPGPETTTDCPADEGRRSGRARPRPLGGEGSDPLGERHGGGEPVVPPDARASAEMDSGRPGPGPEPAFDVRRLEARRPIADGVRQGPGSVPIEAGSSARGPRASQQGDRGEADPARRRLPRPQLRSVKWSGRPRVFVGVPGGSARRGIGVDARGRMDGFLADGAESPGSNG